MRRRDRTKLSDLKEGAKPKLSYGRYSCRRGKENPTPQKKGKRKKGGPIGRKRKGAGTRSYPKGGKNLAREKTVVANGEKEIDVFQQRDSPLLLDHRG